MSTFLTPNLVVATGTVTGMVCRIVNCGSQTITLSGAPAISALKITPGSDLDLSYSGVLTLTFADASGASAVVYTN